MSINKDVSEESQRFSIGISLITLIYLLSILIKKLYQRHYNNYDYHNIENINLVYNTCNIIILSVTMTLFITFLSNVIFLVSLEKLNN
jgi:NADH:ubiquinone oxidoreductase subunit 5 (subunit L)/multisubunit Na+/H+ antiporter MnhA subunit